MSTFAGIFAAAFVVSLSGALMPGPLLAFTVTSAAKRGPYVGILVSLGHGLFECTLVMAIFFGAGALFKNDVLLRVLGGAGALVLGGMGLMMLRGLSEVSLTAAVSGAQGQAKASRIEHPLVGGILLSALNPTLPVWWAGVGMGLLTQYGTNLQTLAYFYAGHLSSDIAWYSLVSLAVGHGRQIISDRVYRIFIAFCAAGLVLFAGFFAYGAITGHKPGDTVAAIFAPAAPTPASSPVSASYHSASH